jgi:asparagine synthase (glutamine-hydrolysing)
MCGIFGYHHSASLAADRQASALHSIAHRGPDDSGSYVDGQLFLAHTRLSIVDVSSNGHQPMVSADGNYIIVFNGEIYNHSDIRRTLQAKGYTFKSHSDTETLLFGYAEFGERICEQLNGIFAFAVYDKLKREVFVARDHFGTKPLYYYHHKGSFAFGSELKSFLSIPEFDRSLDHAAFPFYAQMLYAPGAHTPFKFARKLLPGHSMLYSTDTRKLVTRQYYDLDYTHINTALSEREWIDRLDAALTTATERQLMSDVPVGSFLSGGLDSSLITSYASKSYTQGQFPAFTISSNQQFYNEGFEADEQYAARVAKQLGVHLHHIPAGIDIVDDFDKMIWHLDEPQADPAPLLVYQVCKAARDAGIKVLLSGTAGDDVFTGYRRHQALYYEKYFKLMPASLGTLFSKVLGQFSSERPLVRRLKKVLAETGKTSHERWAHYFAWLPQSQVLSLFSPEVINQLPSSQLPEQYYIKLLDSLPKQTDSINKLLYLEMKTFLPDHNLNYTDKLSMATGVEVRVPFLDQELVNLLATVPVGLKMKGRETKYLLKKVAERHLPKDIIYRPKTGFGAPVRHWVRHELAELVADRLSPSRLQAMGIFNTNHVLELIKNNQSGKIDAAYTIWSLLSMESWCRQFLENEPQEPKKPGIHTKAII